MTIRSARGAVGELIRDGRLPAAGGLPAGKPASEVPFSSGSKRVFEKALEESRKHRHNFIAPEHLAVALVQVEQEGAALVMASHSFIAPEHLAVALVQVEQEGAALVIASPGVQQHRLHEAALARLKGELDRMGALQTPLSPLLTALGVQQHRLHEAALARLKGELDRDGRSSESISNPAQRLKCELDRDGRSSESITNPSSRPATSPTSRCSSKGPSSPMRKGRGKKAAQQSALEQFCTDLTAMAVQEEIDPSHPTLPQPTLPHPSLSHHQAAAQQSALEQFCTDLTAMAVQGEIDPVIGREAEVARVVQSSRRTKHPYPPLLASYQEHQLASAAASGVGKTAIAEAWLLGLPRRRSAVPAGMELLGRFLQQFLQGKRLLSLDMGRVMAGAKERGELELRVTSLVAEAVAAAGEVILVIDEVHTMVGAGAVGRGRDGGGSGLDISNLLKPALSRGQIQVRKTAVECGVVRFEPVPGPGGGDAGDR
ncbi:unnamed protein product [Closterium sp. NIES-64]|nr:unnamed protein product [Closterium sp. NIES-64]